MTSQSHLTDGLIEGIHCCLRVLSFKNWKEGKKTTVCLLVAAGFRFFSSRFSFCFDSCSTRGGHCFSSSQIHWAKFRSASISSNSSMKSKPNSQTLEHISRCVIVCVHSRNRTQQLTPSAPKGFIRHFVIGQINSFFFCQFEKQTIRRKKKIIIPIPSPLAEPPNATHSFHFVSARSQIITFAKFTTVDQLITSAHFPIKLIEIAFNNKIKWHMAHLELADQSELTERKERVIESVRERDREWEIERVSERETRDTSQNWWFWQRNNQVHPYSLETPFIR